MGYTSNVLVQVETKTKEKLDFIAEDFYSFYEEPDNIREVVDLKKPTLIIEWVDVKWYDYYEEIITIMDYLKKLSEDSEVCSVQFVRIGEDLDDMEYNDYGTPPYNYVGVERKFYYGLAEK